MERGSFAGATGALTPRRVFSVLCVVAWVVGGKLGGHVSMVVCPLRVTVG